ncbi:MAG: CBS domain-containing protein [Armatimonadetes bacterium]|nr:CBS domain-containing protein [Armatimonadota bacterium]
MVARDIMTADVVTLREDATAADAATLLLGSLHDGVPVVGAEGQVVGVVSYEELIRLALPGYLDQVDLSFLPASAEFFPVQANAEIGQTPVTSLMCRESHLVVGPDEPVAEVARLMLSRGVRRVVVVEGGRLVGIIGQGDIVRALVAPLVQPNTE